MSDSPQDVYAQNLLEAVKGYGYPLRIPEPVGGSKLPEYYRDHGLQIGDVGTVDSDGRFDVLFNIFQGRDYCLHKVHKNKEHFNFRLPVEGFSHWQDEVVPIDKAISNDLILTRGIKCTRHPDKTSPNPEYEFRVSTPTGAILILPCNVVSLKFSPSEQLREVAISNAHDWYKFARHCYGGRRLDRSLYLITGCYQTRCWSLASFNNRSDDIGTVRAQSDNSNPGIYQFTPTPSSENRHGASHSGHNNQTIFITGFKIAIASGLIDPIVTKVMEPETISSRIRGLVMACLNSFYRWLGGHKPPGVPSVEPVPISHLSQPFHPSDIINHRLLSQNPDHKVAVTHDDDWMHMMERGLTHAVLLDEDRLGAFITQYPTMKHESAAVYLKVKIDDSLSSGIDPHNLSPKPDTSDPSGLEELPRPSPEPDIPAPTAPQREVSSLPTVISFPQVVITRIRAQNILIGRKRIPIGFYVLVQVDGAKQRTKNKSVRLSDSDIEWEDLIFLPSQASGEVKFTVYASFELDPMLGDGETLYRSEAPLEQLVGGTYLTPPSQGESGVANPGPSLLITLERWYSTPLAVTPSDSDSNLIREDPSELVDMTRLGQEALLRYYNEYQQGDLESAVHHFECAMDCPPDPRHRAAVLVNLANAKLIRYEIDPTSINLDTVILLYEEALTLRHAGHSDRPATLLFLAQALLFRYGEQGYAQSVADRIIELMSEFHDLPEDTPECRHADLILDTLERYRVVHSGSSAELDKLVRQLTNATKHPDGYFDEPQRLINLSAALWRRYEEYGEPRDFDELLAISKQALQLLPNRTLGLLPCLKTLSVVEWELFNINGNNSHLREVTILGEEALRLMSEGHPERPYWIASSKRYLAEMSEYSGDEAFKAQIYEEAITQYSQALVLWSELSSLRMRDLSA